MGYEASVRKLHGKVKILYQGAESSYEIDITTSSQAEISFPKQTYQGNLTPTVKACTMDGNSTMNGEYQMLGYDCIVGWWSNELCDANGYFTNPPSLTMNFIKRPVNTWTIVGDNKLNQYPVDFDIIAYDENGNVLANQKITNNELMQSRVVFEPSLENVKQMQIMVRKWSQPNAVAKIIQFFDTLEENYTGNDLKNFEILESLATDSEGISYGINSDTLTVCIYNRDRKFDLGYLKDFLLLDRKVIPYIGIEDEDGNINYTQIGVFYSDEWSDPQKDQWVTLKCLDRLLKFQKVTYIGYPFAQNVSLKTITMDILQKAGLTAGEYEIDDKLEEMVVPYAFLGKKSVWDALQDVCNAGLCRVYTTRDDKVKVSVENLEIQHSGIEIRPNRIFDYEKQTRKTDFSNHIEVNYSDINASLTESTRQVVYSNAISIDAKSKRTMIVDFSQNVTDASLSYLPLNNLKLNYFESSINCGKFEIENTSDELIIANIEITGLVIQVNTQTVVIEDEESVENYGVMAYKHNSSDLVQTYNRAVEIGNYLITILNQGSGNVRVTWRGDPSLLLEDKFTCEDRFGKSKEFICQYNRFTFDGGLKQETKAREV